MKLKYNESGITHLVAILVIVVIAVIGFVGWKVWDSNAEDTTSQTKSETQTAKSKDDTENAPVNVKYLTIKEWGVKFTLSSSVLDASYVTGEDNNNTDFLLTNALKGTECNGGYIIKFNKDDFNSETKRNYIDEFPEAVKIKDSYYAYGLNPANTECSDNKDIQNKANKAAAEFKSAVKTIQSVD